MSDTKLSVFNTAQGAAARALSTISSIASERVGPLFPQLLLKNSIAAKGWVLPEGIPQEARDVLPQGEQAFKGVFLGWRLVVTAWPTTYDENNIQQPEWTAAIPGGSEHIDLAIRACKKYQFTKKDKKPSFDGLGHPRPVMEILAFFSKEQFTGPVVLQSGTNFAAMAAACESLLRKIIVTDEHPEGGFPTAPCLVTVGTEVQKTATPYPARFPVLEWILDTKQAKPIQAAFDAWRDGLADEIKQQIVSWINCTDMPLTDDKIAKLEAIASHR